DCYTYAIELNQNYTDAWTGKGNALMMLKSPRKPKKPKKKPADKKELSKVAEKMESLDDALKCFVEALKKNPNHAKAMEGKGLALCEMGKIEEGLKDLDMASKVDPEDMEILVNKGKVLTKLGKGDEAKHTFNKIMEAPFSYNVTYDPDCWVAKGLACFELDRYDDSMEFYDKALVINPDDPRAWYGKGDALTKLGEYTQAIKCYEKAIQVKPRSDEAWHGKGTAQRYSGQTEEALWSYDKSIEINPRNVEAWYDKGTLLTVIQKFSDTLECFVQVLDINPYHKGALKRKEEVEKRLKKEEDIKTDAKNQKDIIQKKEASTDDLLSKARRLITAKRYNKALEIYNELLKRDTDNPDAWNRMADLLSKMGRYTEAMSCYEMAIKVKNKKRSGGLDNENAKNEMQRLLRSTRALFEKTDKSPSPVIKVEKTAIPEKPEARKTDVKPRKVTGRILRGSKVVHSKKVKIRLNDLDSDDKNIISAILEGARSVPAMSEGLGIPIAAC
ncbi:MAG: tetratricopeptide repeat protein, partial [Thermoplasmata archaeon]|nr:tetratricopeptide repeat protein [Thermoplasmata archaeon]